MNLKDPKVVIRNLFKKYVHTDGNVIMAEKMFVVNSVVNWIFEEKSAEQVNKRDLAYYGEIIIKYFNNELDIALKDGKLIIKVATPEQNTGE